MANEVYVELHRSFEIYHMCMDFVVCLLSTKINPQQLAYLANTKNDCLYDVGSF